MFYVDVSMVSRGRIWDERRGRGRNKILLLCTVGFLMMGSVEVTKEPENERGYQERMVTPAETYYDIPKIHSFLAL